MRDSKVYPEGGSSIMTVESQGQLNDQSILQYGKTALNEWEEDNENSELANFSLFLLLNDGDSDLMANYDELQPLLKYVEPQVNPEGVEIYSAKDRMLSAFKKL